jgi:hypothetical protein
MTTKATTARTIRTSLHFFQFNTQTPEGKTGYEALKERIAANGPRGRRTRALSQKSDRRTGTIVVDIEPAHIFNNQWNTTTERVFDWYEEAIFVNGREQKHIRRGHWLELTPELIALRTETVKCGYCGKLYGPHHAPKPDGAFCTACIGSEY